MRLNEALVSAPLVLALLSLSAGCRDQSVRVSDAPRDGVEASSTVAPADDTADRTGSDRGDEPSRVAAVISGDAPWIVPDGWRESPDRPPMRHATYLFDDESGAIEVAITRFPGDVGGMLANVNRWRGQVGLAPISAGELPALLEPFSNPGYEGHLIHLQGERGDMLVASVYESAADRTWFVRVIADPQVTRRVKDEVFAFSRTFGRTAD